jgi:hypothetical protein
MELTKEERLTLWGLLRNLESVGTTYTIGDNNWQRVYNLTVMDVRETLDALRTLFDMPYGTPRPTDD